MQQYLLDRNTVVELNILIEEKLPQTSFYGNDF